MLDRVRDMAAEGLAILAARIASEPRYPGVARVAVSSRTLAGVAMTPDIAVTVPTVWAAVRYLQQTVGVLPWHVMRDGDDGAAVQKSHPVDRMLYKRPNPEWSSFQFRETLLHWALLWGNGYAEIERDQAGRPFALWPIHPERVDVCRDTETGDLFYEVSNGTGGKVEIAAADMFHIRGFGHGPVGVNVIHYAAQSIGWARAAQLFGATFFGNGANPATVVINKSKIGVDGLKLQRAEFDQLNKGIRHAHGTVHLGGDGDIKRLGLNAEESQLIEVHQHLVEEICRWIGVPPHKVMHLLRATFSNIEHQAIEVVVDSVSPWVTRFEDEADWKLFGQNRPNFYTKMNMKALLRGDSAAQAAFLKEMVGLGAYSPNKVLKYLDENTIGAVGDIHVMQSQWTTLDKIGKDPEPVAPPKPPAAGDDDDDDLAEEDAEAIAARASFETMMGIDHVEA